jgi:selenocysteine-specific elongation factor
MSCGSKASGSDTEKVKSVVLGTAGHIDHGKTALVLALTGMDTDRLPEEKSRGITIDLGFARLPLVDASGRKLDLSLIDVPGHHAFIRNMLAGAAGIDCVMLVVAADEGVKPQTEEHLAICTLLGIERGLIVLTKRDVVEAARIREVREEVRRLVEDTPLAQVEMLAVSALTGEGISQLKAALARLAMSVPERSTDQVMRLPLDRAFSVRGFGTVVTGTLQAGSVRAGKTAELQPGDRPVRLRGVQVHGMARAEAHAPGRVALNLSGVEVADVARGDMLVFPGTLDPVSTVDVEVRMLPGAPVLRHRSSVRVHAFASESLASILFYDADQMAAENAPGSRMARLRLRQPMVLIPGDRFVLRQLSPALTIAGGRVLDAHPLRQMRRAKARGWLGRLRDAGQVEQLLLRVERRGSAGITISELVRETGWTADTVRRLSRPLVGTKRLVARSAEDPVAHLLWPESLALAADAVLRQVSSAKGAAIALAELRSKARLNEWVFELAVETLRREGRVELQGTRLSLAGSSEAGAKGVNPRLAAVEAMYRTAGLASPILSEVSAKLGVAPKELSGLVTELLRARSLVRMGADNLLTHREALERLAGDLRAHRGESFDVARFKSFTGLTRKHVIPLLEYLDGARVTRNANGVRVIL